MAELSAYLSISEAADLLGLSRERVRVLADDGRLEADHVAGRVLLPAEAVHQFAISRRRAGRPLGASRVWELINSGFIARLLSTADDAGQRNIRVQLAGRGEVHDVFVLPQFIGKVGSLVLPGGRALAESANVPAGRDLRWELAGYIPRSSLEQLRSSKRISDVRGEPNVQLRVIDDRTLWPESRANQLVLAWLDLADAADRAAEMTLRAMADEVRRSGVQPFPVGGEVLSKASLSVLSALNDDLTR